MTTSDAARYIKLTEQHYCAIGKVIVEWANVQVCVGRILSRLSLSTDFMGTIISNELSAARIENAARKAIEVQRILYGCHFVSEGCLAKIESALTRVATLRAKRNKLSHFIWLRQTDEYIMGVNPIGVPASSPKFKGAIQGYTLDELSSFHEEAINLVEHLTQLIDELPVHEVDKT